MTRTLGWLAALGLLAGLAAGFGYAPREAVQGNVQRIMYLHVPSVLTAYLAFGLILLLGLSAALLTSHPGIEAPAPESASQVQLVSLHPDASGRVTLEWRDGNQRTYRVFKSDNPRDFSKAASYRVRGNRWTDPTGGADQVAYYRVE